MTVATQTLEGQLRAKQAACQVVYKTMIERLVGFSPCGKLTVDDVLYIARTAQTLAFEAMSDVEVSA
jgi:hypothetical protein